MNNGEKKNVRLSLAVVGVPQSHYVEASLSLLSLASYLIDHGVLRKNDIQILNIERSDTFEAIQRFKPDIVGLSVSTPAYAYATKIARRVKNQLGALVVIGGHHVTGLPEDVRPPFDLGVIGEGEGALFDIVTLIKKRKSYEVHDLKKIANLAFRDVRGELTVNPMRPLLSPEEIPVNRWDLIPREHLVRYKPLIHDGIATSEALTGIFTSRGCPYNCIFCARQVLWTEGRGYRIFPIKHVVNEVELLYKKYHIDHIFFADDTFAVSKVRVRALIEELRRRKLLGVIKVPAVFVRANLIDREFIDLLKELGVYRISVGIETGSPKMLRYLKSGPLTVQQVKNAIQLSAEQGIYVGGNFMLFSPHETPRDFELSYTLAQWLSKQPNVIVSDQYITTPLPGTGLWHEAIRERIINPKQLDHEKFIILHRSFDVQDVFFRNGMSKKQLQREWNRFNALAKIVRQKAQKTPGWKAAVRLTDKRNKLNDAKFAMKERIRIFFRNPVRGIIRLSTSGEAWKHIYTDTRQVLENTKKRLE